jgi:RHS repeat-associated protein
MQNRPGVAAVKGNRLLMQGDRHYDYDAFGNLIRERRGTGQKLVTEYAYDCQHRLVSVTTPDGRCASYRYDAFGRRIAKTVDGKTTEFFWQGDNLVAESSREHYRSYVYEPGTFRPLAMLDGKGPRKACPFYYQLDHLGTPQELTDFGGEIVWSAKYNAYGKVTRLAFGGGEQLEQPLRFQGQYFDGESGLHYNRHRYYDPEVGRYLTPDPVKLAGGLNGYRYALNPTGWVDPLGLSGNCPPPNKPGCGAPDDTTGAEVDEGEPSLPKLTPEQRRARIDELAEANAKGRVIKMEKKYKMHTVQKHSSEIPDVALKQRAINGANPKTGRVPVPPRGNLSSQFSNWRVHLNALNKAMTRGSLGLDPHTGWDHNNDPIVRMELPGAGRGYRPNKKDKQNPTLNENLDWFEVKFDQDKVDWPYTGFPSERK